MKRLTTAEFIIKAKEIHGDKYNYSKTNYVNCRTNVIITCIQHGDFFQRPNDHIYNKSGCIKCSGTKKLSKDEFVSNSVKTHGDIYDYSLVKYIDNKEKVKIICKNHGVFLQTPNAHISQKCGCPKCAGRGRTTEDFIVAAKNIHANRYDYSLSEYVNINLKVKIICPIHGMFEQIAHYHINKGCGCPTCNNSLGENLIKNYLINKNIKFKSSHIFKDCKNIKTLPFDFYLPDFNMCIEFDGVQHYKPIAFFGGEESLEQTKKRDKIKTNYCSKNNILLIRIKYDENIAHVLNEKLLSLTI